MKEENGGEPGAHCWAAYGGVISNPFKPCVFGPWPGQASPLHFHKESTGFDIISLNVNRLTSGKNPENMVSFPLDYSLSGSTGLTLYDQLHAMRELEAVPAIILSASVQRHTAAIESRKLAALAKPFEIDALLALIEEVVRSASLSSSQHTASNILA